MFSASFLSVALASFQSQMSEIASIAFINRWGRAISSPWHMRLLTYERKEHSQLWFSRSLDHNFFHLELADRPIHPFILEVMKMRRKTARFARLSLGKQPQTSKEHEKKTEEKSQKKQKYETERNRTMHMSHLDARPNPSATRALTCVGK